MSSTESGRSSDRDTVSHESGEFCDLEVEKGESLGAPSQDKEEDEGPINWTQWQMHFAF